MQGRNEISVIEGQTAGYAKLRPVILHNRVAVWVLIVNVIVICVQKTYVEKIVRRTHRE